MSKLEEIIREEKYKLINHWEIERRKQ